MAAVAAPVSAPRIEKTIDRDWTFHYAPAADPDLRIAQPAYDDSRWPAIALPHTWSTYETTGDLHPFIRSASERDDSYWWYGWGWYRKHLAIGKQYDGRLIALEFDGVQKYSKIYLNGALVGEHKGGYTTFSVDITKYVKFGEPNLLAVQVSNRRDDNFGRIPPMTVPFAGRRAAGQQAHGRLQPEASDLRAGRFQYRDCRRRHNRRAGRFVPG